MTTLQERESERIAFLLAIYEMSDGNPMEWVLLEDLAKRLGVDEQHADTLMRYFVDRGMTEFKTMGGHCEITALGVDAAEDLIREGAVVPYSVLILSPEEHRAVEAFLTQYRRAEERGEIDLPPDDQLDADAQVQTVEAQVRSPKPRRRVIRAALGELAELGRGASGNAVWEGLKVLIESIG